MHAENLVKKYHQCHPLETDKRRTSQGTKELIRVLQLSITSPSPTQKVKAWLLGDIHQTLPLHTSVALQSTNKYLPLPLTSLWPLTPSELSKRRFLELAQKTLGSSYKSLHALCEQTSGIAKGIKILARKLSTVVLGSALLRVAQQASSLKTPPCTTLPSSGRGRPL